MECPEGWDLAREPRLKSRKMHETLQSISGIKTKQNQKTVGFQPEILRILIFYEKSIKFLLTLSLGIRDGFFSD